MLRLEQFGFFALWSPYFFFFSILVIIGFFYIAIRKKHWFEDWKPLSRKEKILFPATMILIYIIKGSPIDLLGHLMFTFHMIQMALLFLLTPQLLIAAVPNWMWKKIIHLPMINKIFFIFTKPLAALVLFNGMFSFYHIPMIFDLIKTNIWYHAVYTILLFIFAVFMWWPLLNKVSEYREMTGLKKLGYLFADSVLITPACALIIFNPEPMFQTYTNGELWMKSLELCVPRDYLETMALPGPEFFNPLPLNYDQQMGGVIMKVLQELIYGVVLFRIFVEWYRKENVEDPNVTNIEWYRMKTVEDSDAVKPVCVKAENIEQF